MNLQGHQVNLLARRNLLLDLADSLREVAAHFAAQAPGSQSSHVVEKLRGWVPGAS